MSVAVVFGQAEVCRGIASCWKSVCNSQFALSLGVCTKSWKVEESQSQIHNSSMAHTATPNGTTRVSGLLCLEYGHSLTIKTPYIKISSAV